MIQTIKNILGIVPKVNMGELIANGAIIIDVRSKGEYAAGHLKNSINIPLNQLSGNIKNVKSKEQPIITCCASGMRSANAKSFLKGQGFTDVHNGGSWYNLKKYEK
ncbi:MAG: rhodanese-like domain-containing protein [Bacteroidia bacterium]